MPTDVSLIQNRDAFHRLLTEQRPKLHRYCARMTGSVIDGEDVVQDTLVKAMEAFNPSEQLIFPQAWLFRIAHNAAQDFLRRRARQTAAFDDEELDMVVDPLNTVEQRRLASEGLRTLMHLSDTQRSSVILMDVLGFNLDEICEVMAASLPAVKSALHRGRARLRALVLADEQGVPRPALSDKEQALLRRYVDSFNARDFDAIRKMIADDVQLELVSNQRMSGRADVAKYFGNYENKFDWKMEMGFVDRQPAVLVADLSASHQSIVYFIIVSWTGDCISNIRDFRYARYAVEGAEIVFSSSP